MVEPAAVVAFHSFFTSASRASLHPAVPAHSAFRSALLSIAGAATHAASARLMKRVKGRPRARPSLEEESRRWLAEMSLSQQMFALAHSLWCPDRDRLFMWKEVIPRRHRTSGAALSELLLAREPAPLISPFRAFLRHASSAASQPTPAKVKDPVELLAHDHVNSLAFVPEESWQAWTEVRGTDALGSFTPKQLLAFGELLVDRVEGLKTGTDTNDARKWGIRITDFLQSLHSRSSKKSTDGFRPRCLAARASALRGDFSGCAAQLAELRAIASDDQLATFLLPVYQSLLLATWRHRGNEAALEFVLEHWDAIAKHLGPAESSARDRRIKSMNSSIYDICETIDPPASILVAREQLWDEPTRRRVGELLIEALCARQLPEEGMSVLAEMKRQGIPPSLDAQLPLVRGLVRSDSIQTANTLYTAITDEWGAFSEQQITYLYTGLYLFAHQGHEDFAQQYFDRLTRLRTSTHDDKALLIHASAVRGKTQRAVKLFEQFFPMDSAGKIRRRQPRIVHYATVIYAHAQCADFDGMDHWLNAMIEYGHAPDEHVYNTILHSFARRGEVESVAATLDQMRATRVQPTAVSYTTAITLLANRRDVQSAEALYKRALREGVVPDRRMITALMNAHVEAGSWKGVIRTYDYLQATKSRHIRLTVEVYNTLLKAYVLIGAPFRVVSTLYRKMEGAQLQPDARSFALLIQSACDAGRMDTAADIFYQMDKLAHDWLHNLEVNAYVLSIIMAGHLRLGNKAEAKAVYDEMRARGIQPTSITFASIVTSYANEGSEESIRIARDFLTDIMQPKERRLEWMRPAGGRATALQHVYSPLLAVYARDGDKVEDVENLVQEMLDAGAEPSLDSLIFLLDAYRRSGNIDAVNTIWPQIFELASTSSRLDGLLKDGQEDGAALRQSDALCVPLSIYIDALSAAGNHLEIARVWQKLKLNGFQFNSHNWNHLAVALVRAGEPERAFEIVERVILPYQRQARKFVEERDRQPDSPLAIRLLGDDGPPAEVLPNESPMRRPATRALMVRRAMKEASSWLNRDAEGEDERDDDLAHPLHILHQVSPAWMTWAPHSATLHVFHLVLGRLRTGRVMRPVAADGAEYDEPMSSAEDLEHMARVAAEMLDRVGTEYPQTCAIVDEFARIQQRKAARPKRVK